MDPSELGSFLTGIRYHILIWIGNKEGMMAKAIKIILLLRHLQSPLFYYSSWDLFLWKSDQRIRDVWICKVRCSKCDETMADITNFCIKCKTKLEIGRTVMKKAEDQVDNYNLVESWVLMVKSSKSRSQSWKRVPIVQICVGQRFANLLCTVLQNTIMQCTRYSSDACFIH